MESERRTFLNAAGTLGAAALVMPRMIFAQALAADTTLQGQDYYESRVREWLYLYSPTSAQQGNLRLLLVEEGNSDAVKREFSLILGSRRGAFPMSTGYYNVAGESFSLYIQHTHEKRDKQFYLAHFVLLNS